MLQYVTVLNICTKNFHGLVQRLVLKEKQVLQLQAEVDRFKSENPSEGRDAVSWLLNHPQNNESISYPG